MSDTDLALLERYTRHHAEDAFAEIVRRHLDLVHSAALRQVRSTQLAEEVAQATFVSLARHAPRLAPDTILTAWLYQVARREAIDVVRREARRQVREQIATEMNSMNATAADWTHIEPLLDEAMHALDETDRAAVLLRYFENKSLREVGASLGTSDDAAQKRVTRAVERLREFFAKHGVNVGASGLAAMLTANAVQAAPVGLAVTIATAAALVRTTVVTTATATATKAIAMTTLQKAIIAVIIAASVGTAIYEAHEASTLRSRVQSFQEQQPSLAELDLLRIERKSLTARLRADAAELENLRKGRNELLRLRGQIGALRQELAQARQPLAGSLAETNDGASSWVVGEIKPIGTLKNAGLSSPVAAVETFWWAAANNNVERMKQCIVFDRGTRAEQVSDLYAKRETQFHGRDLQSLEDAGVRLTTHTARWLESDRTSIGFQVTGARLMADGTMGRTASGEDLQLLRVGDEWKVIRDEKRVRLTIQDDDSEAVAKMMMRMDPKTLEHVKSNPSLPAWTLRAYEELKAREAQ